MIEASAGKHVADQTSELTNDILKDDDVQPGKNNHTDIRKSPKQDDKLKSSKYLLSGIVDIINAILRHFQ